MARAVAEPTTSNGRHGHQKGTMMGTHIRLTDDDWLARWRGNPAARPGHPDVRFEEGIGWDSDVPAEFMVGMNHGERSGARPNQNQNVFEKLPQETMRERAHVGSSCWVDSPAHLGSFAAGTNDDRGGEYGERTYAHDLRNGGHYSRPNKAAISRDEK